MSRNNGRRDDQLRALDLIPDFVELTRTAPSSTAGKTRVRSARR